MRRCVLCEKILPKKIHHCDFFTTAFTWPEAQAAFRVSCIPPIQSYWNSSFITNLRPFRLSWRGSACGPSCDRLLINTDESLFKVLAPESWSLLASKPNGACSLGMSQSAACIRTAQVFQLSFRSWRRPSCCWQPCFLPFACSNCSWSREEAYQQEIRFETIESKNNLEKKCFSLHQQ